MFKLTIDKLEEGMVLAQDVTRGDGVVLISAGRTIDSDVISLLGRLDVESVVLEGDLFASEEERIAHRMRQEAALDERFSRVTGDPVLMAVREMYRRKLRQGCASMPAYNFPPPEEDQPGEGGGEA